MQARQARQARQAGPARRGDRLIDLAFLAAASLGAVAVSPADAQEVAGLEPADRRLGTARAGQPRVVGEGRLSGPETVLWDEAADVYLVSNINGELTVEDDNGFISRVSPDGEILELRWIDGHDPSIVLHAPKGMIIVEDELLVADLGAVRVFDRSTGALVRTHGAPDSYMLNDLAADAEGRIYVTDTGGERSRPPGAVYRVAGEGEAVRIAEGAFLERPDGIVTDGRDLLVTTFAADANEVYRLTASGERTPYATLPDGQLDGLLRLPDDSLLVTSWQGNAVYRLLGPQARTVVGGIGSPAQIGYDEKRHQLLVPAPLANRIMIYPLEWN
ncbi:MAG: SMP-30/gluconolactonase/LRE family protein [Gammaproteobacteria bacterium]|nr:SMP-30/gluconolactonase/LRE family protein [Gammaproteobacteria bacterium]